MSAPPLDSILFLSIETVAMTEQYETLDERFKALWLHKARSLHGSESTTEADLFAAHAALYAEFGKIICIAVGALSPTSPDHRQLRVKPFCGHQEGEILRDFSNLLSGKGVFVYTHLCAHHGKDFTFPYICRRMLINRLPLPGLLDIRDKKPWETPHLDTMDLWKFGEYRRHTSLRLLAALFNIPAGQDEIDGSEMGEVYYKLGDLQRIARSCMENVVTLAQVYLNMRGLPSMDIKNIVRL